ncbi:hypothetical protein DFQ04_0415 [Algoriphagus boseongensis]|uniref:Uncharacterized protein n=1 Tax=Algoriphagus boseongensis TaxID=1442587 RepID=A0A4R6T6L1_9BACT|nr:hypothetical protein [Algoriphagus boseongensis]TDQ18610.1 hypothetical protein DFQ04_0415 [Algoriphagus boseongensis]
MCVQGKDFKCCSCPEAGVVPKSFWKYLSSRTNNPVFVVGEAIVPYVVEESSIELLAAKIERDLNSSEAFDFDLIPHSGDCIQLGIPFEEKRYSLVFKYSNESNWSLFHVESDDKPLKQ